MTMKPSEQSFFSAARRQFLSDDERGLLWSNISASAQVKKSVRKMADARRTECMNPKQFFSAAKNVQLSEEERDVLFGDIHGLMHQHEPTSNVSHWLFELFRSMSLRFVPSVAMVFLVMAIGGGAVSYAAESSLPGDMLYAFKVGFSEPIRERLAFGSRAKVDWQLRLTQRRLSELKQITATTPTDDVQTVALSQLHDNLDQLHERVAVLQEAGDAPYAEEATTTLESMIAIEHESLLDAVVNDDTSVTDQLGQARIGAIRLQNQHEEQLVESLHTIIEEHIAETEARLQAIRDALHTDSPTDIELYLHRAQLATQYSIQARSAFNDGDRKKALHYLREARKSVIEMETAL